MKKILIVEDDIYIQDIFKIIFKSHGYNVESLVSGDTVIEEIGDIAPDIIILDKQLPGMSGIEICKRLKTHDIYSDTPIIMISAFSGVHDAALRAGADDYIEKPFNMHIILKKVSALLSDTTPRTVL